MSESSHVENQTSIDHYGMKEVMGNKEKGRETQRENECKSGVLERLGPFHADRRMNEVQK